MPKEYPRARRVAGQIQRELSRLITTELQDPRLRLVTVTEVDVSPDLSHAKVFVTVLGAEQAADAVVALRHASAHLRHLLGRVLRMRHVPELRFVEDRTLIEGSRLSALINRAVADDERRHAKDDQGTEPDAQDKP